MSRILLLGVGPLPRRDLRRLYATGLRLDAFLQATLRAGCEVHLGEIYFPRVGEAFQPRQHALICEHRQLPTDPREITAVLDEWIPRLQPDGVVALTDIAALAVAQSRYTGPLHVDYFGHPMAERQQQAAAHQSDAALHDMWRIVLPVLLRADRFSGCSNDQRLALIGELGAAGRLNAKTSEYPFVEIVPPTLPFSEPLTLTDPGYLRSKGVPEGARVVLSSGGFNTWMDQETLFLGVEQAMQRDPALHFVCTGGAIEGHVTAVYTDFTRRVEASPHRARFHLLGWVPHAELDDAMLLSHVAVNCDHLTYEGELGCRNRLYGWLWAGLRVVTTVSSEPTRALAEQGWVRTVPPHDPAALADALLEQAALPRQADLGTIHERLRSQWGAENFYQDYTRWVQSPRRAPDRAAEDLVRNPLADLQRAFLAAAGSRQAEDALRRRATEIAETLLGSRAIQLYGSLHPATRALIEELKALASTTPPSQHNP